ncbi:MAG: RICIN domain-containing protein [Marinilabiliaceae bacterium]|nr:RICIN domain-containing protein [Marinilabiliaceae bacterium]
MLTIRKLTFAMMVLSFATIFTNEAQAYDNEVYWSNNRYRWKIDGVEKGSSTDYATAIQSCIDGAPWNWIHVTTRGNLSKQINLNDGTGLDFHGNKVGIWHNEKSGLYARGRNWCSIINVTLDGGEGWWAIWFTECNDMYFSNVTVQNHIGIGIRIDSHPSKPYEDYWVDNLDMSNCSFYNLGSHGLETYGVRGNVRILNTIAHNCGGCGICLNKTDNAYLDKVDAYRCAVDNGYAGLRLVNWVTNSRIDYVKAIECGRGYVTGKARNVVVDEVYIRDCVIHDILLTMSDNVGVNSGTYNGEAINHYTNEDNCWINATYVDGSIPTGWVQLQNRNTGMYIDGYGKTSNGSDVYQHASTTHYNSQWMLERTGDYYYIINRGTGMKLDGYGRTTNGSLCAQYNNTTHVNAQWKLEQTGSYYFITNRGTGMRLDGYGETSNGSTLKQYMNTTHVNAQWSIVNLKSATAEPTPPTTTTITNDNITVFPNPSVNGSFNIDISQIENKEIVNVEIYSYDGKKVFNQEYYDETEINLNLSLNKGIYIVVIKHGDLVTSKKLTVQ